MSSPPIDIRSRTRKKPSDGDLGCDIIASFEVGLGADGHASLQPTPTGSRSKQPVIHSVKLESEQTEDVLSAAYAVFT